MVLDFAFWALGFGAKHLKYDASTPPLMPATVAVSVYLQGEGCGVEFGVLEFEI